MTRISRLIIPYIAIVVSAIAIVQGLAVKGDQEVVEESLVAGCIRGNELRVDLQDAYRRQITRIRASDPNDFPDISAQRFQELLEQAVAAEMETIRELAPVDCEALYP